MAFSMKVYPGALDAILKTDPRADAYVRSRADAIIAAAATDFIRQQRPDNEWRTSETTPPKYINSFGVRKLQRARGLLYQAYNDDPAAVWVEYGAQAGGHTFVLRYKPLTHGLEVVGGGV
jgi:hypothetical protein